MQKILLLSIAGFVLSGCQQTMLTREPGPGELRTGERVYVDDGTCPSGQVKEVIGSTRGVPRQIQCVSPPV